MSAGRSDAFTATSVPAAYDRLLVGPLFTPWARDLVARAAPAAGARVLDVATGPGTVARVAAAAVGPEGSVVGCDISPAMLAVAASKPPAPGAAPISYLECPAGALAVESASFDAVLCQQGIQFVPDRLEAAREMRRALAPAGVAVVSAWASERPLALFGPLVEALGEAGLPEPYPNAFDTASYAVAAAELEELMAAAGFGDVRVETVELDCTWESVEHVAAAVDGTPFGPLVAALDATERERVAATVRARLGAEREGPLTVTTASNVVRAVR